MFEFMLVTFVLCAPIGMVILYDWINSKTIDEIKTEINLMNNRIDVLHALIFNGKPKKTKQKTKK